MGSYRWYLLFHTEDDEGEETECLGFLSDEALVNKTMELLNKGHTVTLSGDDLSPNR